MEYLHDVPKALRVNSTKSASQVCPHWRNLILESSSIWARLVLIDKGKKKGWMEDVMRKTGSSLLWVEVDITSVPSVEYPGYFFTFFFWAYCRIRTGTLPFYGRSRHGVHLFPSRSVLTAHPSSQHFFEHIFPQSVPVFMAVEYLESTAVPTIHSKSTRYSVADASPWGSANRWRQQHRRLGRFRLHSYVDHITYSLIQYIEATIIFNTFIALQSALTVSCSGCSSPLQITMDSSSFAVDRLKMEFQEFLVKFTTYLTLRFEWAVGGPPRLRKRFS